VLDARDPEGTRCRHLEQHLRKNARHKHMLLLLNKCDLVRDALAHPGRHTAATVTRVGVPKSCHVVIGLSAAWRVNRVLLSTVFAHPKPVRNTVYCPYHLTRSRG